MSKRYFVISYVSTYDSSGDMKDRNIYGSMTISTDGSFPNREYVSEHVGRAVKKAFPTITNAGCVPMMILEVSKCDANDYSPLPK